MKAIGRRPLTALFGGAALAAALSLGFVARAQENNLAPSVTEGESIDQIVIGSSTAGDVVARYGADYKLVKHKQYSYEMIYKNLGLAFYYCAADPNKEIFVVEVEPPSRAVTAKGVTLGESSLADVFRLYGGESEGGDAEYDGISFFAEIDDSEEDGEDDRDAVPAVNSAPPATKVEEATELRADLSNIGLDNNDVPQNSIRQSESENEETDEQNELETETVATKPATANDERKAKSKIVKRIELFEKGGLRQCDAKFSRN